VVMVSSIHANLTKPGFMAYAEQTIRCGVAAAPLLMLTRAPPQICDIKRRPQDAHKCAGSGAGAPRHSRQCGAQLSWRVGFALQHKPTRFSRT